MTIKYTKPLLITAILKELPPESAYHTMTVEQIQSLWFVSKRGTGLQLTAEGNRAFQDAEIESYDRPLPWPTISGSILRLMPEISQSKVELSRKITCPYYLFEDRKMVEEGSKLVEQFYHNIKLYDSYLTVWIDMRGGIQDYLKSVD